MMIFKTNLIQNLVDKIVELCLLVETKPCLFSFGFYNGDLEFIIPFDHQFEGKVFGQFFFIAIHKLLKRSDRFVLYLDTHVLFTFEHFLNAVLSSKLVKYHKYLIEAIGAQM
jgi:hypothetical protein